MTVVEWFLLLAAASILTGATIGLSRFYLECRTHAAADQFGAGAGSPCDLGESGEPSASGAENFAAGTYVREWTFARSRPYDWDREDEVA